MPLYSHFKKISSVLCFLLVFMTVVDSVCAELSLWECVCTYSLIGKLQLPPSLLLADLDRQGLRYQAHDHNVDNENIE